MILKFWNMKWISSLFKHKRLPQFHTNLLRLFHCWSSIFIEFTSLHQYCHISQKILAYWNVGEMANKEFEVLALDGHNFPTWATDVKVSLSRCGLFQCLADSEKSTQVSTEKSTQTWSLNTWWRKIIRNHIHPDLKSE
jgi:hypothetical protein